MLKKPLWIEVMAWKLWKENDLQNHDKGGFQLEFVGMHKPGYKSHDLL